MQLLISIESMVFQYPGMGAKQAELQRMLRAVEAIQAAGGAVNGCFIIEAEGETGASVDVAHQVSDRQPVGRDSAHAAHAVSENGAVSTLAPAACSWESP